MDGPRWTCARCGTSQRTKTVDQLPAGWSRRAEGICCRVCRRKEREQDETDHQADERERPRDRFAEAVDGFLRTLLEDGPVPAGDVYRAGRVAGFSRASIQRSAKRLGIERRVRGGWIWELPRNTAADDAADRRP